MGRRWAFSARKRRAARRPVVVYPRTEPHVKEVKVARRRRRSKDVPRRSGSVGIWGGVGEDEGEDAPGSSKSRGGGCETSNDLVAIVGVGWVDTRRKMIE